MTELLTGLESKRQAKIGLVFSAVGVAMFAGSVELSVIASQQENRWTQAAALIGAASTLASGALMTLLTGSYTYGQWKNYRNSGLPELHGPSTYEPIIVLNEGGADLQLAHIHEPPTNPKM